MWMFDFFTKPQVQDNTKPAVKWVNIGSIGARIGIKYNFNTEVYFQFYNKNPYVLSAINRIMQDVWGNGFELVTVRGENRYSEDFEILEEFAQKWNKSTFKKLLARIVRDYEISGNAYVYLMRDEGDNVVWLQALDPRHMTPVTDSTGEVLWYIQNLAWIRGFSKDEVYHLKDDSDTEDETLGKSKMTALYLDLMSDKEAWESNYNFFANNQIPASLIVLDKTEGTRTEDDMLALQEIKSLFTSDNFWGGKNSNRTAFVEWLQEIMQVQQKQDDMQFEKMRRFTLEMVCAVYGVPKDILGLTETSNRSVWDIQSDIYYTNINTKENVFQDFINSIIHDVLWEEYEFVILRDNLKILERKARVAKELYKESRLITLNEAREIIQYDSLTEWDSVFSEKEVQETEQEKKD